MSGLIPTPEETRAANIAPPPANFTPAPTPVNTAPQPTYSPSGGAIIPQPVSVLSSSQGQTLVNNNTQALQKIETPYTIPSAPAALGSADRTNQLLQEASKTTGITPPVFTNQANQTAPIIPLSNPTGSPAVQSMVDKVNEAVGKGNLTSEEISGLKNVQGLQDQITQAAARARLALESGDYSTMDTYVKQAQDAQKAFTDMLSKYFADVAPLRQKSLDLLAPSAREQELSRQVADIKSQIDQFNLQTEEDKFNEYDGQTLGFAGGRAAQIDRKAEFKRTRMALTEQNLLTQLGLEQDARKMQQASVDKQLSYLSDDEALQEKVQNRLQQMEDDIYQKTRDLQGDAKNTLSTILDNLGDVDPSALPQDSMKNLETLAARAGLPFDLVLQAMQASYLKSVAAKATDPNKLQEVSPGATLFDPATGKAVYTAPTTASQNSGGSGGGGGGGTSQPSQSDITALKNALNQSKFQGAEADGKYADPNLYLANYNSWLDSGGDATEFFRLFPPATYINPANTWLPPEIMQFVKKPSSSGGGSDNPFL